MIKPKTKQNLQAKVLNYILFFFVCAFLGWIFEVILTFFQTGAFVNRGVLHGFWLPIYGFGGVGILLLVGHLRKFPPLVFLASASLCGALEYFTGWYLETFHRLKWWDYGDLPLNLHGRIWILSILSFGLCGLFVIYAIYPRFHDFFARFKLRPKQFFCAVLMLIFLTDFVYSIFRPNTGQGITIEIPSAILDRTRP